MSRRPVARIDLVLDTNVVFYYLLKVTPFWPQVRRLLRRAGRIAAPASWEAEILSALWKAVGRALLSRDEALAKLAAVSSLQIESVPVPSLWSSALVLATGHKHSPHDTLFVALAQRLERPLVTYDERVLERFPGLAVPPEAFG
jgi:predicted nucleic acid-binding protein